MIGKIKGKIDSLDEDSAIVDVGGVGYHVFCSSRILSGFEQGQAVELIIETHVREDHIHLFGFPDTAERDWFRTLNTVQGVGVKMAQAILGAFTPAKLAHAIAAKDTKALTAVSGIGPKLAERIVTELKNKIAKLPAGAGEAPVKIKGQLPPPSINEDTISALVNLGYNRSEAYNAVMTAVAQ